MHDPGSDCFKSLQHLFKSLPVITSSLTSSIQPSFQNTFCSVIVVVETFYIPDNPIVVKMTTEFRVKRFHDLSDPFVPVFFAPLGQVFDDMVQLFTTGLCQELIFTKSAFTPFKLKSQKRKRRIVLSDSS